MAGDGTSTRSGSWKPGLGKDGQPDAEGQLARIRLRVGEPAVVALHRLLQPQIVGRRLRLHPPDLRMLDLLQEDDVGLVAADFTDGRPDVDGAVVRFLGIPTHPELDVELEDPEHALESARHTRELEGLRVHGRRINSGGATLLQQSYILPGSDFDPLFRFGRALDNPFPGLGHLGREGAKRRAQMLRVTEMGTHARAQLGLVDELVRVGAVLKGRLGARSSE